MNRGDHFDPFARVLHWGMAVLILAMLFVGVGMVAVDMMVMSCYALLATRFRPLLRNPRLLRLQNRIFGGLFVGAGAMLAASSR